jgi:hypothetical protein
VTVFKGETNQVHPDRLYQRHDSPLEKLKATVLLSLSCVLLRRFESVDATKKKEQIRGV